MQPVPAERGGEPDRFGGDQTSDVATSGIGVDDAEPAAVPRTHAELQLGMRSGYHMRSDVVTIEPIGLTSGHAGWHLFTEHGITAWAGAELGGSAPPVMGWHIPTSEATPSPTASKPPSATPGERSRA